MQKNHTAARLMPNITYEAVREGFVVYLYLMHKIVKMPIWDSDDNLVKLSTFNDIKWKKSCSFTETMSAMNGEAKGLQLNELISKVGKMYLSYYYGLSNPHSEKYLSRTISKDFWRLTLKSKSWIRLKTYIIIMIHILCVVWSCIELTAQSAAVRQWREREHFQ